ncbi:hypothetical protein DITRI_Ditri01bG0157200 [Diplodiscus trichospermus]
MERMKYLYLSGTTLKGLPSSIDNLVGLRVLRLNNCENLGCLPDNFYKLQSFRYLYLFGCTNLVKLPDNLFDARRISELDLNGNNFDNLPTSIKQLPRLEALILRKCKRLKSLPELPASLRNLDAHDCTALEEQSRNTKVAGAISAYGKRVERISSGQASPQRTLFITCFPGSEITECFNDKSLVSSITIQLPSERKNGMKNFPGFIVATVVSFQDYSNDMDFGIRCEWHLKSSDGHFQGFSCSFSIWKKGIHGALTGSNHLFLLYKTEFHDDHADEVTWYREGQGSDKCIYNEVSFKFYPVVHSRMDWSQCVSCEVENCWVHLLFGEDKAQRIKSFISDQVEKQPAKRLKYHS